jgi:putative PIN family toxin of toxin-antitoxin system
MSESLKVVFDCNIYLQALAKPNGPAGRCMSLVFEARLLLYMSAKVFDEIRDVTSRAELVTKFRLRPERVQSLLENLPKVAVVVPVVQEVWTYQRDPDDAHYVNRALAADARLIVSRDRDLLDLMSSSMPEPVDFRMRFPTFRVSDPVAILNELNK